MSIPNDRITQKYIRRYPESRRTKSWAGRMVQISTENGVWRVDGHGYTYAHEADAWVLPFEVLRASAQPTSGGTRGDETLLASQNRSAPPAFARHNACHDDERGPCSWAEPELCSHCADSIALLEELITGISPTDRVEHCTGDVGDITVPMHHAEQLLTILRRALPKRERV
jgi:hypothetical protein